VRRLSRSEDFFALIQVWDKIDLRLSRQHLTHRLLKQWIVADKEEEKNAQLCGHFEPIQNCKTILELTDATVLRHSVVDIL
jgi:hypothetical protein